MENRKAISFVFSIIAIILGVTLFKQFNFESLTFEKPTLAVLYFIVFAFSIYILVKKPKKQSEK
jgi:uncharacterized membrane protein HdeD (DUF308 family)